MPSRSEPVITPVVLLSCDCAQHKTQMVSEKQQHPPVISVSFVTPICTLYWLRCSLMISSLLVTSLKRRENTGLGNFLPKKQTTQDKLSCCSECFLTMHSENTSVLTLSRGNVSRAEIQAEPQRATISFRQLCNCCSSEDLLSYFKTERTVF